MERGEQITKENVMVEILPGLAGEVTAASCSHHTFVVKKRMKFLLFLPRSDSNIFF